MEIYLNMIKDVLENGTEKSDRTGTGTRSVFGRQIRFKLQEGFPLVTTKKVHLKSVIYELLWFLNGDTNIKYLNDHGVGIWDEWADSEGGLGPAYGAQWRSWPDPGNQVTGCVDQISDAIDTLRKNPDSRRIVVSAWNVAQLHQMVLAPCHCLFQFNCREIPPRERAKMAGLKITVDVDQQLFQESSSKEKEEYLDRGASKLIIPDKIPRHYLDCQLYQRSADLFLGVPFNIASYSLLTMMMAQVCNMIPGEFIHTFGDMHIYLNHMDQVKEQLSRKPRALPVMNINDEVKDIFSFKYEDFRLDAYDPYPAIKAPVAV